MDNKEKRINEGKERLNFHGRQVFVLVHGASRSAADWYGTAQLLERLGHRVYAVNLPGHGPDTRDLREQTLSTCADDVAEFIRQLDEKVILVGHSMAGALISLVGERIPEYISGLVYLAAWLLEDGQSCNGLGTSYAPLDFSGIEDGIIRVNDVRPDSEEVAADPREREIAAVLEEPIHITKERFGSLRRFYIATLQDEAIDYSLQEKVLEKSPCEVVYEMNCGHYAMKLCTEELSFILHDIARRI